MSGMNSGAVCASNNNLGSNSVSWSGDVPEVSAIQSALNNLEGNLEGLHDSLRSLECRFGSVMLPEAPTAEGKAGPSPVAVESQVLYTINMLKQRVIDANNRVASIIGRAQV